MTPRGAIRAAFAFRKRLPWKCTGLFHVAIKTNDLDATVKFYTDVLGMKLVHRPDFGFPGRLDRGRRQHARSSTSTPAARRWSTARRRTAPARSITSSLTIKAGTSASSA
jgi:hypothetical protein